jgi:hypothetical protein
LSGCSCREEVSMDGRTPGLEAALAEYRNLKTFAER